MTSVLARAGHLLETRHATLTLRQLPRGKRKRGSNAVRTAGRPHDQQRAYSERKFWGQGGQKWPPREEQNTEPTREQRTDDDFQPWGLETRESVRAHRATNSRPIYLNGSPPESNQSSEWWVNNLGEPGSSSYAQTEEQDRNVMWEQLEQVEDEDAILKEHEDSLMRHPFPTKHFQEDWTAEEENTIEDPLSNLDYKQELSAGVLRSEADLIARCLYAANGKNDVEFIRSISDSIFSEILRILEPRNFISKIATTHLELSDAMVKHLGITPMPLIAYNYSSVLSDIITVRRLAGLKPSFADYTILLRGARDLGRKKMSTKWLKLMLRDEHEPDTACYNYFLSAQVWHGVHRPDSRRKYRTIPFHLVARKQHQRQKGYRNYRIGAGGVVEHTLQCFNDMLQRGIAANEGTFRILIIAAAREGDMTTAKSILKNVWGIDVDALLGGIDESSIRPNVFAADDALRPTSDLLFAIAHAFGINNDVPSALRVVDFVARHYDLGITHDVWEQLFEWTFVLSIDRHGTSNRDGSRIGELPPASVMNLWNTMTGPPYFIQPTMGMYNYLIKNTAQRAWTPMIVDKMQEGAVIYRRHRHQADEALRELQEAIQIRDAGHSSDKALEWLRNNWEYLNLIYERDTLWVKRWLKVLLSSFRDWNRIDATGQMSIQELPSLLWEWRAQVPDVVLYETMTGFVTMRFRTYAERKVFWRIRASRWDEQQRVLQKVPKYVGNDWLRPRRPELLEEGEFQQQNNTAVEPKEASD